MYNHRYFCNIFMVNQWLRFVHKQTLLCLSISYSLFIFVYDSFWGQRSFWSELVLACKLRSGPLSFPLFFLLWLFIQFYYFCYCQFFSMTSWRLYPFVFLHHWIWWCCESQRLKATKKSGLPSRMTKPGPPGPHHDHRHNLDGQMEKGGLLRFCLHSENIPK